MNEDRLRDLLKELTEGRVSMEEVLERLKALPFEDIEVACIDHHRSLRRGAPEVIFGEGKEVTDILAIMEAIDKQEENILITRLAMEKAAEIKRRYPDAVYHEKARVLTYTPNDIAERGKGPVLVICAGTSDMPVAEEAVLTARFMGNRVHKIYDVGVAGLHRLLRHRKMLIQASVIIVVAGMEGALPSVVGGLVDKPVIAVPTSVGYGASFGGIAALLGMLNSCASGVTVVNIDNGFGAAYAASLINRVGED
ncbi:MAG: nickel pincer cofactor biosynthesis protein LarB [Deltaproteobacteria bacterium]|nr:nickel pincer cofactor biosynthesis protein LarB [Deltaproteobacteria bacterium]